MEQSGIKLNDVYLKTAVEFGKIEPNVEEADFNKDGIVVRDEYVEYKGRVQPGTLDFLHKATFDSYVKTIDEIKEDVHNLKDGRLLWKFSVKRDFHYLEKMIELGLSDPEVQVNLGAAKFIEDMPEESIAKLIRLALQHRNVRVRYIAAKQIGLTAKTNRLELIKQAMADKDCLVRHAAITQIGCDALVPRCENFQPMDASDTTEAVMLGLKDADSAVRLAAISKIEYIGRTPRTKEVIKLALYDKDLDVRVMALYKIDYVERTYHTSLLKQAMQDSDARIRSDAVDKIHSLLLPSTDLLELISFGLQDSDVSVRRKAAEHIDGVLSFYLTGQDREKYIITCYYGIVKPGLEDDDTMVRLLTMKAIRYFNPNPFSHHHHYKQPPPIMQVLYR